MPLVRTRQTAEAATVADRVLQLKRHGDQTVGVGTAFRVASKIMRHQLVRLARVQ